jgi:hypothetical protein
MTAWLLAALAVAAAAAGQAGRPASPPAPAVRAQLDGHVAIVADVLPRGDAFELRPQLRIDVSGEIGARGRLRFGVDALAQGLAASRRGAAVHDAAFGARDAWIEIAGSAGDLRAGFGRVIWGRLDEVQPSDVVNPIDAAKFLLDGRSAARRPVWFTRARLMPSDRLTIEGVLVPRFRRSTFDELDEETSPFNLIAAAVPPGIDPRPEPVEPAAAMRNVSGGGRVSVTVGRVDIGGAVYRGFDGFGIVQVEPVPTAGVPPVALQLRRRHPRFTMAAADFETVAGEWALRGEAAWFGERTFAGVTRPGLVGGRALDAGVGFDRSAGDVRLFGTLLVRRQWSDADAGIAATDVSLLGSIERSFARERYRARLFGVVNPGDAAGFVRGLFTWSVRDNVSVEASAAVFLGDGDDLLSRFRDRDFGFTRMVVYF